MVIFVGYEYEIETIGHGHESHQNTTLHVCAAQCAIYTIVWCKPHELVMISKCEKLSEDFLFLFATVI